MSHNFDVWMYLSVYIYILCADKIAILVYRHIILCRLHCISVTIQMTDGRMRPVGHVLVSPDLAN
jgi:hypothetical protein